MSKLTDQANGASCVKHGDQKMDYDGKNLVPFLSEATDTDDWERRSDAVKRFHDGQYPENWYTDVITSGLMDKVMGAGSSEIKFSTIAISDAGTSR